MLDDMLSLILDEKFPRTIPKKDNRLNRFKLLYSDILLNEETKYSEIINLRRSFKAPLYPFPEKTPI